MAKFQPPNLLLTVLRDLTKWLQAEHVPAIIIGGVAASILGRPRMTQDVDVLLQLGEEHWDEFLTSGEQFGFVPRRSDALTFARKAQVLLLRHTPSGIDTDMVIAALPFEKDAIARSKKVRVGEIRLPLPLPEDLITMKAVAGRPRDMGDIESILDAQPKTDIRRVRRWVRELAAGLAMPEILEGLEAILSKRRRKKM